MIPSRCPCQKNYYLSNSQQCFPLLQIALVYRFFEEGTQNNVNYNATASKLSDYPSRLLLDCMSHLEMLTSQNLALFRSEEYSFIMISSNDWMILNLGYTSW